MSDEKVPEVDMNAPLPSLEEPKVDEVMIVARREWYVGIGLLAIFVAVVGAVGWGYSRVISQQPPNDQIQASATPAPTASPEAALIKPKYAVWNGSGIAGAAGVLAEKLKAAGYEVLEIKNAPVAIIGNQIEVKSESFMRAQVERELEKIGINISKWSAILPSNVGYDVKIVIGK